MDTHFSIGQCVSDLRDRLQPILEPAASEPTSTPSSDATNEEPSENSAGHVLTSFDGRILHPDLIALCRPGFESTHYADASRRGAQYLSQEVLARCRTELQLRESVRAAAANREPNLLKDGSALMEQVFALSDPVLLVPPSMETESDRSEQLGYGNLMKGVIGAFRNPRSHNVFFEDDPLHALLIIELVQHLLEIVAESRLLSTTPPDGD